MGCGGQVYGGRNEADGMVESGQADEGGRLAYGRSQEPGKGYGRTGRQSPIAGGGKQITLQTLWGIRFFCSNQFSCSTARIQLEEHVRGRAATRGE